ncbi:Protein of unknown function (DUF688 [Striga hermonthica]|uniref:Uncharacterized protein n=1 Tax=Striga hermonthica TaxID=68872 RepID=A0A9N7RD05_STRHE|nr:Protein of unknown function (DUF688 [Striga hermonthica]
MEKRQLDFSAPLLSARRLSSPRKSSELVHRKSVEKRVPPEGRTKPAAVPFNWEQTPGRAKNEPKPKPRFPTTTTTPRLPPGWVHSGERKFDRGPTNPTIYGDHASLIEKLDESLKCKDESENSDAENVEETYSDAINALSLNDSCSVSDVSGNHGTSGRFSVDKQTRDLMMSRFLPAAKAVVVLETPQYAAKKPAVVGPSDEGAVKEVKKKVVYGSSGILRPYGTDDFDGGESEDEEEDGERGTLVRVKKAAGKSWGIIPRICVKRSLCLLKPIPAMKSSSRHPTPTAGEERRLRRNPSGPLDKVIFFAFSSVFSWMSYLQGVLSDD